MAKYLTEFVGTFLFLFVIALVVTTGSPLTTLAIGCALMTMVYMGGHVSGGHYNPAVTLSLASVKKTPASDVVPYLVAQILGGLLAFVIGGWVTAKSGGISPGIGVSPVQALVVEFFFTLALVLVILNVACTQKTSGNSYYGLAIGFTIVIAATAGGGISGGAFNPAVGIGATVSGALMGGKDWASLWIYLVGPIAGGLVGAQIWQMQNPEEKS